MIEPWQKVDYHEQFSHLRLHGEWFSPAADLLAVVTTEATRTP